MKSRIGMTLVAGCCLALAGCWFYSRPEGDPSAGCQKTTYGIAIASSSNTTCDNGAPPPAP